MADYTFKVEIELDTQKILNENIFSVDDIFNTINSCFSESGVDKKESDNELLVFSTSREDERAFSDVWIVIVNLIKSEWFRPYVTKLLWYNAYEGDNYFEDTLKAFADKGY